ncbi:MAG TPA: glycerol-3-phosphate dehydrogenase/oxidase [Anaerolineae bacterium]|nr:glycerol-3-phosphate dehydrogenase/oxidase [Anaerolineae bacterium]
MWNRGWRELAWDQLDQKWDMIIIGGGITGAGIFRLASQLGLKVLLIEKHDFAYGTSSKSSKLVHGGLRYLKNYQFKVTYESVQERQRLLKIDPNLVLPLVFVLPVYKYYDIPTWKFELALAIYDFFGRKRAHGKFANQDIEKCCPQLNKTDLTDVLFYHDAVVDDARLVLCTLRKGVENGGLVINYAYVQKLISNRKGKVIGVLINDQESLGKNRYKEIFGSVIINATGPWSDDLRKHFTNQKIIRKLRGSHLIFPKNKLPIEQAYLLNHPSDGRSIFAIPWENTTIIGTTDLDHPEEYERLKPEPFITIEEVDYLLTGINTVFPQIKLSEKDILSTFSGLRPIVNSGSVDPSKASRAHKIIAEHGFYTIAGGKLTTYLRMAEDLVKRVSHEVSLPHKAKKQICTEKPTYQLPSKLNISKDEIMRLSGRLGNDLQAFLSHSKPEEFSKIDNTNTTWAELRWSALEEGILHLDDLLLRRTHIGLLCENGAKKYQKRIQTIIQAELGWDNFKWKEEWKKYIMLWNQCYYLPS